MTRNAFGKLLLASICFIGVMALRQNADAAGLSPTPRPILSPPRSDGGDVAGSRLGCSDPLSNSLRLVQKVAQTCKFTKKSLRPLPLDLQVGDGPQIDKPNVGAGDKPPATKPAFAYYPPGKLDPKDRRKGRSDRRVYMKDIIFPLALPKGMHPHMNSQIYGYGGGGWGGKGAAGGSECDPRNYDPFRQRDNYCEVRGWKLPLCPSGTGHQGLDIRPPSCSDSKWAAVAVADGIITRVTSNTTVVLKATKDGTSYYYLHMNPKTIRVKRGQKVLQGDVLGKISKYMGGRRQTTTHLHFMAKQNLSHNGRIISTYVPIYTSLIAALREEKGIGASVDANDELIVDANYEIGAVLPKPPEPDKPAENPEPDAPGPISDKPTNPSGPTQPPGDKPAEPGPVKPKPDLTSRIAVLEQKLNQLKVDSQRQIEQAQGETTEAKAALVEANAKLVAAIERIEEREAVVRQTKEAARQKEGALQAQIDQAAAALQNVKAELEELRNNQNKPGIWDRIKGWWQTSDN
jgi:murein DD-endopeptidase MepM/ murein hydrolase activator NlpD